MLIREKLPPGHTYPQITQAPVNYFDFLNFFRGGQTIDDNLGATVIANSLQANLLKAAISSGHLRKTKNMVMPNESLADIFLTDEGAQQLITTQNEQFMAGSDVTTAVRNPLSTEGKGRSSSTQDTVPAGTGSAANTPPPGSATLTLSADVTSSATTTKTGDVAIFARLSAASRSALGRAIGMQGPGAREVHMENLVVGLYDLGRRATRGLFEEAQIDRAALEGIILETVRFEIPLKYEGQPLTELPEFSPHAREALEAATKVAGESGPIRSRHLLYGALSVEHRDVIKALNQRGVRKSETILDAQPRRTSALGDAAPAPKVDSDLWCEVDTLGYEAYARTIAGLITHRETVPPLTIGIKAPWGAGKTSLMKRGQHLLDGKATISEENRAGSRQQWQAPQITLREMLDELKRSIRRGGLPASPGEKDGGQALPTPKAGAEGSPPGLPLVESEDGKRYQLQPRITVWFNAWKYQTSEQIWAGMAHCIISQITARMGAKDREMFWLRLHLRRVKVEEVRLKVYEVLARQLAPLALLVVVLCLLVGWVALSVQALLPYHVMIQGISFFVGIMTLVWKGKEKLGEKAAGTVRELVREPDYVGKMGYLHLVESDIEAVLDLAAVTRERPLVVFVDDLDRCAPNKVAEVVEAINLFLCGDYPNCIFVIGMEPGMVAAALEVANKDVIGKAQEMGLVERNTLLGWRFMEKIVQLPVTIPPPTESGRRQFVGSLTAGMGPGGVRQLEAQEVRDIGARPIEFVRPTKHGAVEEAKVQAYIQGIGPAKSAAEAANKGVEAVEKASAEDKWAAREAGNRLYEQTLSERDPAVAEFARQVAVLVDGNPRQIKRYVNVFRFYSTLRQRLRLEGWGRDLPTDRVLAKFVALSIRWPHAVDCLRVQVDGEDGKKVSLLKRLEGESRKTAEEQAGTQGAWKQFTEGLGLPGWAAEKGFREFLAEGEQMCENEGHGLW